MSTHSTTDKCSVKGCEKQQTQRSRGTVFCGMHYSRLRRHGTTDSQCNNHAQLFISKSLHTNTENCINWPFNTARGYAVSWWSDKKKYGRVNRIVATRKHGKPPSATHHAAHSCGNKLCINWKHIRWATPKENQADRILHGTNHFGEKSPASKITEDDVRAIRTDNRSGPVVSVLYGISVAQVSRIRNRKTWSWLKD